MDGGGEGTPDATGYALFVGQLNRAKSDEIQYDKRADSGKQHIFNRKMPVNFQAGKLLSSSSIVPRIRNCQVGLEAEALLPDVLARSTTQTETALID